jgi:hypothetical protein
VRLFPRDGLPFFTFVTRAEFECLAGREKGNLLVFSHFCHIHRFDDLMVRA